MPYSKKNYNSAQKVYATNKFRAKLAKFTLLLACAAAILLADKFGFFPNANQDDHQRYHNLKCTVVKVIDGDTLDVDVPDTRFGHKTTRLRLLGIDTPETKRPDTPVQHYGPQASEKTTELTLKKTVTIKLADNRRTRGGYDRLLAYVELENGQMLNRLLVTEGYAYADKRFSHPLMDDFLSEMSLARKAKRGLWQDVRISDLPRYITGQ